MRIEPRALFALAPLRAALERFISVERRRAFAKTHGLDLDRIEELYAADYEIGHMWIASWFGSEQFVAQSRARATSERRCTSNQEGLECYELVLGGRPTWVLEQQGHFVASVVDNPRLQELVSARAQGKLRSIQAGLARGDLAALEAGAVEAPLTLWIQGPRDAGEFGAALLGLRLDIRPNGDELEVFGGARGVWGFTLNGGPAPGPVVQSWLESAEVRAALPPLSSQSTPECLPQGDVEECRLALRLPLPGLFEALYHVVAAPLDAF